MTATIDELPGLNVGHAHLWPYWRGQLKSWIEDAYYYRHSRESTGWSMATEGFMFARLLYGDGQLSREQFRRYCRFNRKIQRIERADNNVAKKETP